MPVSSGSKSKPSKWPPKSKQTCNLVLVDHLLVLQFKPEDGVSMCLRNVSEILPDFMALQTRIWYYFGHEYFLMIITGFFEMVTNY
jgi:hypothetical protein